MIGQARGEDALVADRAVGEDEDYLWMAQREIGQAVGDWRHPTTCVDQDGHAGFFCEGEDSLHLGAVEGKRLRAGVQLDPAGALCDATFSLGDRCFGGVEATEGDQPPLAFACPLEYAVVGEGVGGLALGVVQWEHARSACRCEVEL